MSKDKIKEDAKLAAGKKATKEASKKKAKLSQQAAAKKLADQAKIEMGKDMPPGKFNAMCGVTRTLEKLEADRAVINLAIRGERAKLKEMGIALAPYDQVRKLSKMEPEDARSYKASEALYTQQLGLDLSPQQENTLKELDAQRQTMKNALNEVHGSGSGKEVGSKATTDSDEEAPVTAMPQKNEAFTPQAAVQTPVTH